MELTIISTLLSVALVVVLTFLWKTLKWGYLEPKKLEKCLREQGFRGNPYRFLKGDMGDMIKVNREAESMVINSSSDDLIPHILPYHSHCHNLHGKDYWMWVGPIPRIVISDPKLAREILFNYEDFQKGETNPLIKIVKPGLVGYEGTEWAIHRSLLNPTFTFDNLKGMVSVINLSCTELTNRWEKIISQNGCGELDVWPYLCNLSADVISRTAFGSSYEEGEMIFQLLQEQFHLVLQCMRSVYIPGSRFLPTKTNGRLKMIRNKMGALLRDIIKKNLKGSKAGEGTNDLLGILLKTISKEESEGQGEKMHKMTIEEVIEECKLFYTAGQETTAVFLVWTMVLLSRHQKWQTLARDEIFAVFGDNEPDFDGLKRLKIVTMILYEVLRLYPSVPRTTRRTHKEVKLGEMVLPPGVDIELSFISIQHNPDIWGEDAKEFNPGRFSQGISKAAKVSGTFLSFSTGPRICIGQNFAMMEAKIMLVTVLRCFLFKLSPSYRHAPTLRMHLEPRYGAHLILQKI